MRVADLGEFGLIARLTRLLPIPADPAVVAGIGDDCAVLRLAADRWLLATVDAQVEGVHFRLEWLSGEDLGQRVLQVNLSDIAAMGGQPRFALVSLGVPATTPVTFLDGLYRGLARAAATAGVAVVGGNVTRMPERLWVDLTLLGTVAPDEVLFRRGARVGDCIGVTGWLGSAAAGLAVLANGLSLPAEIVAPLLAAYRTPRARLAEGQAIARSRWATAMIDLSDGLSSDLGHLCAQSGVGAEVWADHLPIRPETRAVAAALGCDPLAWALDGGEDYELLFTAPPAVAEALARAVTAATGTPVTWIGVVRPATEGLALVEPDGRRRPLWAGGYDHFRTSGQGG